MIPQYFKGDATELKFDACGVDIMDQLSSTLDDFFAGAFTCAVLGDVIVEDERSPLSNAIDPLIFRDSFPEIFQAFVDCGSFESYIAVFQKIFGVDVEIEFIVPAPGKLQINITADEVLLLDSLARSIVDDDYVFTEIVDFEGNNIAFQQVAGFQSQYELEQMLFEMVPAGIYTEITLEFAG